MNTTNFTDGLERIADHAKKTPALEHYARICGNFLGIVTFLEHNPEDIEIAIREMRQVAALHKAWEAQRD